MKCLMRIQHQSSHRAVWRSQLLSKSPTDLHRHLTCSKIQVCYQSNIGASWMHFHHCRCFSEHVRMLLHSLRAPCLAPAGPGSIRKYLQELLSLTGMTGRIVCGFQTNVHFADVLILIKDIALAQYNNISFGAQFIKTTVTRNLVNTSAITVEANPTTLSRNISSSDVQNSTRDNYTVSLLLVAAPQLSKDIFLGWPFQMFQYT